MEIECSDQGPARIPVTVQQLPRQQYRDSVGIGEKSSDSGYIFNIGPKEFSERVILVFGVKEGNNSDFQLEHLRNSHKGKVQVLSEFKEEIMERNRK